MVTLGVHGLVGSLGTKSQWESAQPQLYKVGSLHSAGDSGASDELTLTGGTSARTQACSIASSTLINIFDAYKPATIPYNK